MYSMVKAEEMISESKLPASYLMNYEPDLFRSMNSSKDLQKFLDKVTSEKVKEMSSLVGEKRKELKVELSPGKEWGEEQEKKVKDYYSELRAEVMTYTMDVAKSKKEEINIKSNKTTNLLL